MSDLDQAEPRELSLVDSDEVVLLRVAVAGEQLVVFHETQ